MSDEPLIRIPFKAGKRTRKGNNRPPIRKFTTAQQQQVPLLYDPNSFASDGVWFFYAEIWVGTPPQRQTVEIDTGSLFTAFPCQGCVDCGNHSLPYYQQDLSSTFHQRNCTECTLVAPSCSSSSMCPVHPIYGGGDAWYGWEASDVVTLANSTESFLLHFFCQTNVSGTFKTQLDNGIMGMSQAHASYWKQMYDAGAIRKQQFSLCLSSQPSPANQESLHAGTMTLGGSDTRSHTTKMVYAALQQRSQYDVYLERYFIVKIQNMFLRAGGGFRVVSTDAQARTWRINASVDDLNGGYSAYNGSLVDTGNTAFYLPSGLADPFNEQWEKIVGQPFDFTGSLQQNLTSGELDALPTILFQLEGKDNNDPTAQGLAGSLDENNPTDILVAVPPTHYMSYTDGFYHSQIYLDDSSSPILGALFLMGHDVLHDVDGQRMGFSESSCDPGTVVSETVESPTSKHWHQKKTRQGTNKSGVTKKGRKRKKTTTTRKDALPGAKQKGKTGKSKKQII